MNKVIKMIFKLRIPFYILCLAMMMATSSARAGGLIRDTEIESALRAYTRPLLNAAHIDPQNVNLFVLDDDSINAFVAGGQNIFVFTGLLRATTHADEIMGVLAHEIGHIYHNDLINGQLNAKHAQLQSLLGLLFALPVAIVSGTPAPLLAGVVVGNNVGTSNYLDATRAIEARADATAVTLLRKNKMSPKGLLTFMQKLKKLEGRGPKVPFLQDHPLTTDRIIFLQNALKKSPYKNQKLAPAFDKTQQRIRAKLIGYQESYQTTLRYFPLSDHSVPAQYARTIALMRLGKLSQALKHTMTLIRQSPQDPFFQELAGDILRQQQKPDLAIIHYKKALRVIPWAALIHNSIAKAYLSTNKEKDVSLAIKHLKIALSYEPWTAQTWLFLAQAYQRQHEEGLVYYASAQYAFLNNRFQKSAQFAHKAQKLFPKKGVYAVKVQDLLLKIHNVQHNLN